MSLLEEFWYGNIEPMEYDTSSCKEYKKLLELICRNEEKLRATMTDEQKELFEKYTDYVREYQTITDCLLFQNSFKLGARMMVEIMDDLQSKNKAGYYIERGSIQPFDLCSALVAYHIVIDNNVIHTTLLYDLV